MSGPPAPGYARPMPGDLVTMSPTELERLALMRALAEHRTTQRLVAEQLGRSVGRVAAVLGAVPCCTCTISPTGLPTCRRLGRPIIGELALARSRRNKRPAFYGLEATSTS
jgi:hypothetical protein